MAADERCGGAKNDPPLTRYSGRHAQDARDRREALSGAGPRARAPRAVQKARGLPGGSRARDHVGRRPPRAARRTRRVRPQVQALEDGRPAHRPRALQARRARRALAQADVRRQPPARARGRRGSRQRLRRRPRGRAHLRLPLREGQGQEARAAPVAELHDHRRDEGRVHRASPRERVRAARGGRPLALRGRLDRRHERHARRHHQAAQLVRRRRLSRPRADAHARDRRPARGGDPRV